MEIAAEVRGAELLGISQWLAGFHRLRILGRNRHFPSLYAVCTRRLPERPMPKQSGSGLAPASYQGLLDDWSLKLGTRAGLEPAHYLTIKLPSDCSETHGRLFYRRTPASCCYGPGLIPARVANSPPFNGGRGLIWSAAPNCPAMRVHPRRRSPVRVVQVWGVVQGESSELVMWLENGY